jgi:hypothetical protein
MLLGLMDSRHDDALEHDFFASPPTEQAATTQAEAMGSALELALERPPRRAPLLACCLLGLLSYAAPWVVEHAPERYVWSGYALAQRLPWLWAPPVAYLVILAVTASRRTVHALRGVRMVLSLLASIALGGPVIRILLPAPKASLYPIDYDWGLGLYAAILLGMATLVASIKAGSLKALGHHAHSEHAAEDELNADQEAKGGRKVVPL